ncbi:MAG: alkaline phosphatase family protein [Verrucomicrobia bacterium]|nr:alkaline phosphatase family protein [Verrucomicrobiota bacterium]
MNSPTKILFLGFCAGERELILKWADAGILPAIKSLMAKGLTGHTQNLPGFFVGTTWPSIYTGVTPARHGIHSWEQLKLGTYESYRCHAGQDIKREPFWNPLSRAGRRVAIFDVPHSYPTVNLNGLQVVEWGAHDRDLGFMTWPPTLQQEIETQFGQNPLKGKCNDWPQTGGHVAFRALRDTLLKAIAKKAELTVHYLQQGGWDLFAQVFTESHCIGHQCWHLHDPSHPLHDPEVVRRIGDPIEIIYKAIDKAIGRVLQEVSQNTIVIFLAGHGMGPKYQAQFLLDQILLRLKVAVPPRFPQEPEQVKTSTVFGRTKPFLKWSWHHLPNEIQFKLASLYSQVGKWAPGNQRPPNPTIDRGLSYCFPVENNFAHGGIRINLIGREPNGKISPGADCDTFCNQLSHNLRQIINLNTGKPVVKRIIRTAEMYQGPYLDYLPDLLVEWNNEAPVYAIGSAKTGEIRGEYRYRRTGDHNPGGLFIAAGPSIKQGRLDRTVSVMDIAPTITNLLGVELSDVDGIPITEIVDGVQSLEMVIP